MAIFGTADGVNDNPAVGANVINYSNATCPETGTADSITVMTQVIIGANNVKCALYDSNFNLIAETEQKEVAVQGAPAETTFNFSGTVNLRAGTYHLCVWCADTTFIAETDRTGSPNLSLDRA